MNAPRSGCPINLTLEALGDRWSLIVIRELMFGNRCHFRESLTRSDELCVVASGGNEHNAHNATTGAERHP